MTKSVASNRLSYTFSGLQEFEIQIKSVSVFTFESSPVTISMTTMEAGVYTYSCGILVNTTNLLHKSEMSVLTAPASPPGSSHVRIHSPFLGGLYLL